MLNETYQVEISLTLPPLVKQPGINQAEDQEWPAHTHHIYRNEVEAPHLSLGGFPLTPPGPKYLLFRLEKKDDFAPVVPPQPQALPQFLFFLAFTQLSIPAIVPLTMISLQCFVDAASSF